MAWVDPRTWNPGETVTAALMNAHVRDNLNALRSEQIRRLNAQAAADAAGAASVGAAETDLYTYALPAGTLNINLQALRVMAMGRTANNANAKSVRLYLGAGLVVTFSLAVSANVVWWVEALIVRLTQTTQHARVLRLHNVYVTPGGSDTAVDLANAQTLKFTGQGTTTGDILQDLMITEMIGS